MVGELRSATGESLDELEVTGPPVDESIVSQRNTKLSNPRRHFKAETAAFCALMLVGSLFCLALETPGLLRSTPRPSSGPKVQSAEPQELQEVQRCLFSPVAGLSNLGLQQQRQQLPTAAAAAPPPSQGLELALCGPFRYQVGRKKFLSACRKATSTSFPS